MGEGALLAAVVAATAASGAATGVSVHQANVRNEQIRKAQKAASKQAAARQASLAEAAADQRKRTIAASNRLVGRLRTAATARGGSSADATTQALLQQTKLATAGDLSTIKSNLVLGRETTTAQALGQLSALQAQTTSPALVGLQGSLSTIKTGLSGLALLEQFKEPEIPGGPGGFGDLHSPAGGGLQP